MTSVIFDLDGTLVHSAPDIHAALADVLGAEGIGAPDLPTVTRFIGNGVVVLARRVVAHLDLALPEEVLAQRLQARMQAGPNDRSTLYPGVMQALRDLRAAGHTLGLCTNKPQEAAQAVLRDMGLSAMFETVFGGRPDLALKPDPQSLLLCQAALGGGGAVFVGDSEVDAEAAHRAGLPFFLFTGGYLKAPADSLPQAARFDDFSCLPALIARH